MTVEEQTRPKRTQATAAPFSDDGTDVVDLELERNEPIRATMRARLAPIVVFGLAAILTVVMVVETNARITTERAVTQDRVSDVLSRDVDSRLAIYSETLIGLRGLFQASETVTRGEFETYIEAAEIFERFPGVQAMEWAPLVYRQDLVEYERSVRADTTANGIGYPEFAVHPTSEHDDLFVVDYVVPLEGNEAAFGFDLGSNPVRRMAVEEARDSGQPVATAPITLVQEEASQAGMLLLVPVYDGAAETLEQRREGFRGLVLAVFRLGDLLEGASTQQNIQFSVFDTPTDVAPSEERTLIFSVGEQDLASQHTDLAIDVAGRRWEITVDGDSIATVGGFTMWWAIAAGTLATLAATAVVHVLALSRNRAENRAIELTKDLREANADIRRSNADLEKFAYVASHDLQTPARNVKHVVELLRSELPEYINEESVALLKILSQSAERMEELIQGLLDFSRIQRSEVHNIEPVDLEPLLQSILSETLMVEHDSITIDSTDLPTVHGNPQLLGQVLENLLSNAIKYKHPDRDVHISVSGHRRGSKWAIAVADNGLGIDARFHDRIFEMFRRLHPVGEYEGTGIGLALCRKIVERHGGEIWVESKPEEGSAFTFTIADD